MGLSPARGCNCEGSGRYVGERKDEVSVAVEGSKGAVWASVEPGEEDGFLPVKASQNDMSTV